jgi:hypothetical protein
MNSNSPDKKELVVLCREPGLAASRYEILRMSALGEPLPVEYRRGLVFFLRHGMLSWIQSFDSAIVLQTRPHALPNVTRASHQKRAVIHIFAAMTALQQ